MSQNSAPTYSPPTPPTLATASDLYNQAQSFYQNNGNGGLLTAQQTALNNANNPNYYSQFQPISLEQALGSQYFSNVWPDEQAAIRQQFSQSGLTSSPALAETLGRAQGGLETQIGSYLSSQGDTRATNAINAGLGISPNSVLGPYVQTGENQSNAQAQLQYGYQQAQAQQDYQQQMNKYQSQNALASTLGQLSPIGGQIYGGITGTSGSAFGGTAQLLGQISPYLLSAGMGSFGGGASAGGGNVNIPGMGSTSTNGMTFGSMPEGGGYSNTANIFGNGTQGVH